MSDLSPRDPWAHAVAGDRVHLIVDDVVEAVKAGATRETLAVVVLASAQSGLAERACVAAAAGAP